MRRQFVVGRAWCARALTHGGSMVAAWGETKQKGKKKQKSKGFGWVVAAS
jgi:hypothetical protein